MRVELLQPDTASPTTPAEARDETGFARALDQVGKVLSDATSAEDAYANGGGSLQDAVYRRAQADVTIAVATAAVQRAAQAVQTVMNLQI
ncbi:MAG TPA: flagellar hook-basal body complex protein FliE [Candidatus Baltobacteraceae bacterium]|nr:flagellar hook-basal body complex protein FliE [Candidatus Baltobacteraceae bacterium]